MSGIASGSIRFNTDSSKLEIYDGNAWFEIDSTSPDEQTGGTRGLTAGGFGNTDQIEFFNIDTTGNGADFGNLNTDPQQPGSVSSRTRGCIAGGNDGSDLNVIDFITISSTGDALDFGDLITARHAISHNINDRTRGVFIGGTPNINVMEYVTIAQTGNGVDFGDISTGKRNVFGGSSPTRGVFCIAGGSNVIQYITISTLGNSTDFGDTTYSDGTYGAGGSNAVRALLVNGKGSTDEVCFVTIATLGNAIDFGNLTTTSNTQLPVMASSPTRAVRIGGQSPNYTNDMDYAQIMTTGNFIDFGDSNVSKSARASLSNGHGGLG